MKKVSSYFSSQRGMTLIEILVSIIILSIIIVTLLTMLIQSSRTNNTSKNIVNTTYLAENSMEEIRNFVVSTTFSSSTTFMSNLTISGYDKLTITDLDKITDYDKSSGYFYKKINNTKGHFILVKLVPKEAPLVKVTVKVYNNETSSKRLEAQMEMLISWKQ
ncbi:prepilin-type N-terminal cleavage/methylation domain-containing protein [Bacillus sp. X1(2014)]|uniref:prepilin-type N-terminal cleavage/methylation domain-containing protein n=1 Tax=Bacillus sp. X1(2014) TaxID=1565991 RepID=UPI0011A3E908|nr:prepilin-type N-terminal cleavage/methylation domain-containing protein [Bacillus sp. X1(2014)]